MPRWKRLLQRVALLLPVLIPLALIAGVIAAFVVVSGIREILPPERVTMAAGRPGSAYHAMAERYREVLSRDGIEVEILDTPGSMENARLLARGEADFGIVQGGVPVSDAVGLEALAGIALEPFFIFHRPGVVQPADLADWDALRIAAGEPGSGTRIAINNALEVLEIDVDQSRFLPLGGAAAVEALLSGEADVAVFVAPVRAPYLQPLLHNPDIVIRTLRDGAALARQLPYMRMTDIPVAGLDYSRRIPSERVELPAMMATLVIQGDLHPAVVNRLVRAAQEIHDRPSLLVDDLTFPTTEGVTLPLNVQARDALDHPPGFLERVLPFWIAAQITRLTLLIVPLLVLLVPLLRAVPGIYTWSIQRRIYARYDELVAIDSETQDLSGGGPGAERRAALLARLDEIERDARRLELPRRYRDQLFNLRVHIDLVRRRLRGAEAGD